LDELHSDAKNLTFQVGWTENWDSCFTHYTNEGRFSFYDSLFPLQIAIFVFPLNEYNGKPMGET
jgi:hypothetical protein